jgi:hypothetical protein
MEHRSTLRSLIALDGFAAVSAVAGGVMVISAWPYAFPMAWLQGTPFDSYVIPGLLLGVIVGGSAALSTVATLRKAASGPVLSAFAGIVMMGWIAGEILLLHVNVGFTPLWPFYFLVGLAMTLLGLRAMPQGVRSLGHRMHHA